MQTLTTAPPLSPQVLLGWLLEPDAPEEALLLPGLYTAHLVAAPAAAPAAPAAESAVVSADQRPAMSSSLSRVAAAAVCAAATGELLSTDEL